MDRSKRRFYRILEVECLFFVWVFLSLGPVAAVGDVPQPEDGAAETAADQPKDETTDEPEGETFAAVVIEVAGTVEWAEPDVPVLEAEGWHPVKVGDRLDPGAQIRTGLRSHVNLQFGQTTVVSMRSATHASIDQLRRSATVERIRVGLGYGTVRGGSIEGPMRSDVVVDSPVATLAKRGTEGWQMKVESMTGRFQISLARHGLVEAIHKARTAERTTRTVRPGEYATDANIANMWIEQDIFDRQVTFYQPEGLTVADVTFNAYTRTGVSVVAPGGGSTLVDVARPGVGEFVLQQISQNFPGGTLPPTTVVVPTGPIRRPEGNFGTGQTFRVLVGR